MNVVATFVLEDTGRTLCQKMIVDGVIEDVSAGAKIRWKRHRSGDPASVADATIIGDPKNGNVLYEFTDEDFPSPGVYEVEWVITKGVKEITVPSDSPDLILVRSRL